MEHWSDIFPFIFLPFKVIVIGIGGYYAIKWHVDQDNKKRDEARERNRAARLKGAGVSVLDTAEKDASAKAET